MKIGEGSWIFFRFVEILEVYLEILEFLRYGLEVYYGLQCNIKIF